MSGLRPGATRGAPAPPHSLLSTHYSALSTAGGGTRIGLGAAVVDSGGDAVGRVSGLVFERESRRVAGFLVQTGDGVPREVFIRPGQAGQVDRDRVALTLAGEEFAALPDARQHLYVEPGQDLEAEVAAAEAEGDLPDTPDPDERPRTTAIPGVAFLPQMMTPIEVERDAFAPGQVALEEGLRVVAADGAAIGQLGGFVLDDAQLVGITIRGKEDAVIEYNRLDRLDEGAGELTLTVEAAAAPAADAADSAAPGGAPSGKG